MNSVNLIGNICGDFELRQTTSGKSVTQFTLAAKRPYSKDITDFIPIVCYEQPAEFLTRYAKKGTKVAVSGKLTSRNYEDKNGNKRTAFEVVADVAEICEPKESTPATPYVPTAYATATKFETTIKDEDIPF